MEIKLHKLASVTKNAKLKKRVEISEKIESRPGAILAVEVLENKKQYNKLELTSGRFSKLQKGDILAVALGERRALKGFVGKVPKKLKHGDVINILNLGGVAGICISENLHEVGHALKVKVLGAIIKDNKLLNIDQFKLFDEKERIPANAPLIIITGTCMQVGKTSCASAIIRYGTKKGFDIYGAKVAGIASLRDTESMKDAGALKAISLIDGGLTSTVHNKQAINITKGAISYLFNENPDYVIVEFGDGVFGEYSVMEILKNKDIKKNVTVHIGCANDPMGAMKLYEVCKNIGMPLDIISGPVTDNSVGINFIKKNLNIPAFNALTNGKKLFEHIRTHFLKKAER